MQFTNLTTALAAGALVGAVAGVGGTSLVAGADDPAVVERVVYQSPGTVPTEPDELVQWLKQNPR